MEERPKIEGFCTGEGTKRYKERAVEMLGIPEGNFKKPYDLPLRKNQPITDSVLNLSSVGLGTYIGKPDDEDDFDMYVAAKYLLQSGTVNFVDSAINARC